LGLRIPNTIYIHGLLLTRSGVKLSKSLGNAPSPLPLIERYSLDALRYYMAREVSIGDDGTFTPNQFVERINNDLVNNYGNLLNRTLSMIKKYYDGIIPAYVEPKGELTRKIYQDVKLYFKEYETQMDLYNITKGADAAMKLIDLGNKYIEDQAPWTLAKSEETKDELAETMYALCEVLRIGSIILRPILVDKSVEALTQLNIPEEFTKYSSVLDIGKLGGVVTHKGEQLFPRLDKEIETKFLEDLIDGRSEGQS